MFLDQLEKAEQWNLAVKLKTLTLSLINFVKKEQVSKVKGLFD